MTKNSYRWVIVAAGGAMGCIAIAFLAMALGSMGWGMLSDRYGPRAVVLTGAVLLAASLYGLSFVTSLEAFQLIYGVLIGGSMAAFFAPMMPASPAGSTPNAALPCHWSRRKWAWRRSPCRRSPPGSSPMTIGASPIRSWR